MQNDTIIFCLKGCFSASSEGLGDLTPKSKKAVGLLALLVTSPDLRRNRRWLEDKLWSDRAPEQARGSMRQTLCEIRRTFGALSDILGADRNLVWLKSDQVEHDLNSEDSSGEFLEGLEISDPEFHDWLIEQRHTYPKDAAVVRPRSTDSALQRIKIQCGLPWSRKAEGNVIAQIVDEQIGKILSEFLVKSHCSSHEQNADLIVRTAVHEEYNGSAISVQVINPKRDEIVHSDHCFTADLRDFTQSQRALGRLCWNIADRALEKMPSSRFPDDPLSVRSGFSQNALREVLSFEENQMRNSLITLTQALDYLEDGLFFCLKAWAVTSLIMEEFEAESIETTERISYFLRRAIELSPDDPMVCAIFANVRAILFGDVENAIPMARRSLRDNPNNLFALQALSTSRSLGGDYEAAYQLSEHSRTISGMSKFEPMCNLHHSLLCLNMRRTQEALESSRAAAESAPNYRAPRRQMIALHAINDDQVAARRVASNLKVLEPGFSMDRFLYDRAYPTNTLRNTGYLKEAEQALQKV